MAAKANSGNTIGYVFGGWLAGSFFARLSSQVFLGGAETSISFILVIFSVIWPVFYFLFSGRGIMPARKDGLSVFLLIVFCFFVLISCFASHRPMISLGFFCATIAGLYVALLFSSNCTESSYVSAFKLYSCLISVLLIVFAQYDYMPFQGYRLGTGRGEMNPNSIAMIAMSLIACGFSFRSYVARLLFTALGMYIIYLTGSRASMLGGVIILFVLAYSIIASSKQRHKPFILFIAFLSVTIFLFANWDIVYQLFNSYFLFDDKHRGFSSGGSGRTVLWSQMVGIFLENPFFGVGFRVHGDYVDASSAHNGYLATLVEIGALGFLIIAWQIARSCLNLTIDLKKSGHSVVLMIFVSLCFSYLLLAVFERYLVNIGNPVSLVFLVVLVAGGKVLVQVSPRYNRR